MDPINSNTMSSPEIFAMKKAMEVQEQGVMKVLESAQTPAASSTSGSSLTGIGQTLDFHA